MQMTCLRALLRCLPFHFRLVTKPGSRGTIDAQLNRYDAAAARTICFC
jgi:hypothetical protein